MMRLSIATTVFLAFTTLMFGSEQRKKIFVLVPPLGGPDTKPALLDVMSLEQGNDMRTIIKVQGARLNSYWNELQKRGIQVLLEPALSHKELHVLTQSRTVCFSDSVLLRHVAFQEYKKLPNSNVVSALFSIKSAVGHAFNTDVHYEQVMSLCNITPRIPTDDTIGVSLNLMLVIGTSANVDALAVRSADILAARHNIALAKSNSALKKWTELLSSYAFNEVQVIDYDPELNFLFIQCDPKYVGFLVNL
jgi:hypothetical protein